jgi:putative GTP pyrophosphokinase
MSTQPSDLKRDFYALSGLFYVADKHFEMFYGARKHTQEEMVELFEAATPQIKAEQEINLDSLTAYLQQRLPDRKHLGAKEISSLVRELLEAGYTTIGDIEQMLENALDAFLRYENDHPPAGGKFADIGVVRVAGRINDESYLRVSAGQNIKNASDREKVVRGENNLYGKYRKYLKKR